MKSASYLLPLIYSLIGTFCFQRRTTSQGRLSSSSLASIQEECSLQNDLQYQGTTNLPKARFSIASDDSFTDNASLCSSKSDTSKSNSASLESLKEGCDVVEPDTRTKEQIIEEFRNKFESTYGRQTSSFIQPRRRASIHVACLTSAPPPVDHSIRPKLRRASFQCEEVITKKSEREDPISKVISDFKLQYNFPSPLHAVTRQYGSASDITMREKVEPSPKSISKDLKSILSEWAVDKKSQQIKKPTVREQSKQISDSFNRKVIHDRNSSCTSDYFGSTDTLNTIHTLPTQETVNSERRQSLPIIFSTNESLSSLVPKIPERRKSLLDNSSLQSPANVDPKSPNLSLLDADDGICNEGNTDFHSNLLNNTKTVKTNDKSANNKSRKVPLETSL